MPSFIALASIISYLADDWPPPLALSASGPRARLAVELGGGGGAPGYAIGGLEVRCTQADAAAVDGATRGPARVITINMMKRCPVTLTAARMEVTERVSSVAWWVTASRRLCALPTHVVLRGPWHKQPDDAHGDAGQSGEAEAALAGLAAALARVETVALRTTKQAGALLCPFDTRILDMQLTELTMHGCTALRERDLELLSGLPTLRVLDLCDAAGVGTVSWLAKDDRHRQCGFQDLETLRLCGSVELRDLSPVAWLRHLRVLCATDLPVLQAVSLIAQCESLEEVSLARCTALRDLSPLGALSRLRVLSVRQCIGALSRSDGGGLEWIETCLQLEEVDVSMCPSLSDLSPLRVLGSMRVLKAGGTGVVDMRWLGSADTCRCSGLQQLYLENCSRLSHLNTTLGGGNLKELHTLSFSCVPAVGGGISWIAQLPSLRLLSLRWCGELTHHSLRAASVLLAESAVVPYPAPPPAPMPLASGCPPVVEARQSLQVLDLTGVAALSEVKWLSVFTELTEVNLTDCPLVRDVESLGALRKLRRLSISDLPITSMPWIASCQCLEEMCAFNMRSFWDLQILGTLPHLRVVQITGSAIADLLWISQDHFPALEKLTLSRSDKLLDISPLGRLKRLRSLSVTQSGVCTLGARRPHRRCGMESAGGDGEGTAAAGVLTRWLHRHTWGAAYSQPLFGHCERDSASSASTVLGDGGGSGWLARLRSIFFEARSPPRSSLGDCHSLLELDLSGCADLADIGPVSSLYRLRTLNCSNTRVSDLSYIARCSRLEVALFFGCDVGPPDMCPPPGLHRLLWFNGIKKC